MSLHFVLLLLLIGLVNSTPIVVNDKNDYFSNETQSNKDIFIKSNASDQTPVGRTFLLLHLLKKKLLHKFFPPPLPFPGCFCVPYNLCDANRTIIRNYTLIIDLRYRHCTGDLEVCCFLRPTPPTEIPTETAEPMTEPPPPTPETEEPMTESETPMTEPETPPTETEEPITEPPTMSSTMSTTTPIQKICVCIPVFQCAFYGSIGGGPVINPRQVVNTCIGAFVCCSNVPALPPATFPPYTLPPLPPIVVPTLTPPVIVLPPIIPGQSCICMLVFACGLGYIPINGIGNIDPRLVLGRQGQPVGSCNSPNSMCCKIGQPNFVYRPATSQGVPIISGVGAVGAPLITNNVPSGPLSSGGVILPTSTSVSTSSSHRTLKACKCIPMSHCAEGNAVTYDGIGATDPRFGPCASATLVCCKLQSREKNDIGITPSSKDTIFVKSVAIVLPPNQQQQPTCGVQDVTYADNPPPPAGSAYFAEFPWMALLLIRNPGASDSLLCGGSLINNRVVLTAAHCVVSCNLGTLIVRLGEWNTQATDEPLPVQEASVASVIVHPQYNSAGLYNDIALVILFTPVVPALNVRPVCLPMQGQINPVGIRCYASGWGRDNFGVDGKYQSILRKVDLPIVDNVNCESRLRATRLGPVFQLYPGFICAGGELSKDTCYKDGGGPLVCQDQASGRFIQSGIVSWGIGCGTNVPGVYTNVASYKQWIDQQLALLGIAN